MVPYTDCLITALRNQSVYKQRHGNKARSSSTPFGYLLRRRFAFTKWLVRVTAVAHGGNPQDRAASPLFASIKWEENLHHFLPPLKQKCASCDHSYKIRYKTITANLLKLVKLNSINKNTYSYWIALILFFRQNNFFLSLHSFRLCCLTLQIDFLKWAPWQNNLLSEVFVINITLR